MEPEASSWGGVGVVSALVLCLAMALPSATAARCDLTLEIRPPDGEAVHPGLEILSTDPPTGPIGLAPGESVEGYVATLGRSGECPADLLIEWQYETTMAISDEGPHLDLDDWLHFTSEWRELDRDPDGRFTLPVIGEQERMRFPSFPHADLVEAVRRAGGERWERLVSTEESAESSAGVGVSAYRLRIVNGSGSRGPLLIVDLRLPMGC